MPRHAAATIVGALLLSDDWGTKKTVADTEPEALDLDIFSSPKKSPLDGNLIIEKDERLEPAFSSQHHGLKVFTPESKEKSRESESDSELEVEVEIGRLGEVVTNQYVSPAPNGMTIQEAMAALLLTGTSTDHSVTLDIKNRGRRLDRKVKKVSVANPDTFAKSNKGKDQIIKQKPMNQKPTNGKQPEKKKGTEKKSTGGTKEKSTEEESTQNTTSTIAPVSMKGGGKSKGSKDSSSKSKQSKKKKKEGKGPKCDGESGKNSGGMKKKKNKHNLQQTYDLLLCEEEAQEPSQSASIPTAATTTAGQSQSPTAVPTSTMMEGMFTPSPTEMDVPASYTGTEEGAREFCVSYNCCIGDSACYSWNGTATVTENSCIGEFSCFGFQQGAVVSEYACIGSLSCSDLKADAVVATNSCTGESSCFGLGEAVFVSDYSCSGEYACTYLGAGAFVSEGSCIGQYACRDLGKDVIVALDSCQGQYSCGGLKDGLYIGGYSCKGSYSCFAVAGDVLTNSCNYLDSGYACQSACLSDFCIKPQYYRIRENYNTTAGYVAVGLNSCNYYETACDFSHYVGNNVVYCPFENVCASEVV
jgi:hypothetical protein